jgi:hypothetical protein
MNYSRPSLTRREWCALLATLCAPGMEASATQSLWNMLPALQHFPDYLFTPETAQAVALAPRRLATPAFDEISKAINAYRKEFVYEPKPALPAPEPEPAETGPHLSEQQREAVQRDFVAQWRAMKAASRPSGPDGPEQRPLADVTLKGEHLRRFRANCGLNVQVP